MQVYILKDNRQWGPYEAGQMGDLIERGSFGSEDWAWIEGSAEWVPVREIFQTLRQAKKAESQVLHNKVEAAKNQWRSKLTQPTPAQFRESRNPTIQPTSQVEVTAAGAGKMGRNFFFGALGLGLAGFVAMLALSGPREADIKALNLENGLTYKIDSNVPFDGKAVRLYPNGQRKFEAEYKDGLRHGTMISFFPDGARQSEGTMANGQFDGDFTNFHPNGQIKSHTIFNRGQAMRRKNWDENGNILLRPE